MKHARGAAMLATVAILLATPAFAASYEVEGGGQSLIGTVAGLSGWKGLTAKASLRIAESARVSEQMRQTFREGGSPAPSDESLGAAAGMMPLGAGRMIDVRPHMHVKHPSAIKLASMGGMSANYGNHNKTMSLVTAAVASELGLRFVARPLGMGKEMHLTPWSTKHGTGLAASFAF